MLKIYAVAILYQHFHNWNSRLLLPGAAGWSHYCGLLPHVSNRNKEWIFVAVLDWSAFCLRILCWWRNVQGMTWAGVARWGIPGRGVAQGWDWAKNRLPQKSMSLHWWWWDSRNLLEQWHEPHVTSGPERSTRLEGLGEWMPRYLVSWQSILTRWWLISHPTLDLRWLPPVLKQPVSKFYLALQNSTWHIKA